DTPAYLKNTTEDASTENFYWSSRYIAALSDSAYGKCINHIERYDNAVQSKNHELIHKYDELLDQTNDMKKVSEEANQEIADMVKSETQNTLNKVLYEVSNQMKNSYARSDA
ncbi:MAG: C69 family dipeptidase, partial [Lachnospiraceae bacterium]|nr:C69 family dipeptidase [Lachnospiraceae bacterium]